MLLWIRPISRSVRSGGQRGRPAGWVDLLWPDPLTDRAFDLYWIVVDPHWSGQGIGSLLLNAVEEDIRSRQGRMLLIETSSSQAYEPTRRFYLEKGYMPVYTIRDLYRGGEDRLTYIKRF